MLLHNQQAKTRRSPANFTYPALALFRRPSAFASPTWAGKTSFAITASSAAEQHQGKDRCKVASSVGAAGMTSKLSPRTVEKQQQQQQQQSRRPMTPHLSKPCFFRNFSRQP
jgi:hypothetical protein